MAPLIPIQAGAWPPAAKTPTVLGQPPHPVKNSFSGKILFITLNITQFSNGNDFLVFWARTEHLVCAGMDIYDMTDNRLGAIYVVKDMTSKYKTLGWR